MSDCTIFEQDGKVYAAMSHAMPARELAKCVAEGIRAMPKIPRARMRVVPIEEVMVMPFGRPKKEQAHMIELQGRYRVKCDACGKATHWYTDRKFAILVARGDGWDVNDGRIRFDAACPPCKNKRKGIVTAP